MNDSTASAFILYFWGQSIFYRLLSRLTNYYERIVLYYFPAKRKINIGVLYIIYLLEHFEHRETSMSMK